MTEHNKKKKMYAQHILSLFVTGLNSFSVFDSVQISNEENRRAKERNGKKKRQRFIIETHTLVQSAILYDSIWMLMVIDLKCNMRFCSTHYWQHVFVDTIVEHILQHSCCCCCWRWYRRRHRRDQNARKKNTPLSLCRNDEESEHIRCETEMVFEKKCK